jgi:ubiquitin-conjugating enzyme E2 D/E
MLVFSQVTFKTRIYHCNVDATGKVHLDILKDGWSPAFTISKVLLAIKDIISNPDPCMFLSLSVLPYVNSRGFWCKLSLLSI